MTARRPDSAEERLGRIAEAQAMLADVSRMLGPALDLGATVKAVLAAMRELVEFRGGSISLVEHDHLRIAASDPPVSDEVLALRLPVGQGISGRVVASLETLYSPDLDHDDRVDPEIRSLGSNRGITSYLAVPLVCLGRAVGVLQVDSAEVDAFDEIDVMLLEGLAAQTANAIESARQFEQRARIDALKHDFINMVSHELRTPLTIASGMVRTYRSLRDPADDDVENLLDRGEVALARLGRLIEELLMMSQLAAGEVVVSRKPVDAGQLIADVIAGSADADAMSIDCPDGLTWKTDGPAVTRILDALVENAVTYAGGGRVVADAEGFAVVDEGPGLPDDVVGDAGRAFARSSTNPTTIAGLGLGLTLANALVAELDGHLSIKSEAGKGTTVRVDLRSVG